MMISGVDIGADGGTHIVMNCLIVSVEQAPPPMEIYLARGEELL
jgi:hypothetical protein